MFTIYSSSAGSGKTYTLTKEYLKLVLRPGVPERYFRHILAITFTNAAANEMKSRILKEIRLMAAGEETAILQDVVRDLYGHERGSAGYDVAVHEVRGRAGRVFTAILHNYSDFSVTTIDAFTQRLVTAFTEELGLPFSFEVELDTDDVLELAIDNLLERAGTDEMAEITDVLRQFYLETATEGKSWNGIPETLKEFAKNLTYDKQYVALKALDAFTTADFRALRQQMQQYVADTCRQMEGLAQQGWALIQREGLSVKDFSYGAVGQYFEKRLVLATLPDAAGSRVINDALSDDVWYPKKATLTVQDSILRIKDELRECIVAIEALRSERSEWVALCDALEPHLQKLSLLKQMRVEFDALLRKDGRVHISEFNTKIKEIVENEPMPFIFERMGVRYHHVLIDEFQDTSRLQFANFLPLIENTLSAGHSNLAVGDGKQAIYRWRGGDMDQIVALHSQNVAGLYRTLGADTFTAERLDTVSRYLEPHLLDTNWRSAAPIVQFNNDLFDFLARRYEFDYPRVADVFDRDGQFKQKPSPRARPNAHVQLDFVARDEKKDLDGAMLAKTLELLRSALADGYQYGDVAILCRKKSYAKLIANELNAQGIPLVSADSLSLEFSDPVKWLVTVMTLLHRPDLKLVRYETLYLFCRVILGQLPDDAQTEALREAADAPDVAAVYDYLAQYGYVLDADVLSQLNVYELAEKLTRQFGLFLRPENGPFLFRFFDEVLTFANQQSGHLADFLHYWETAQTKVSVSESGTANAVRIQTIHKAKGLEFPVVIVPFANWSVRAHDHTMWVELEDVASHDEADPLTLERADGTTLRLTHATASRGKLRNAPDPVAAQHREEDERVFLENLNMLYVALTRPTDRLYLVSELKEDFDKGRADTVAHWLYGYLNSDAARQCGCGWEEGRSTYEICGCADANGHVSGPVREAVALAGVISGGRGQQLQLRRQAERVFDVATFARTRERDRKLMAALSLILGERCLEKTLRRLVREGLVRSTEYDELYDCLSNVLNHPDLADAFGYDRRIDTDRSILQSGAKVSAAPHRVVHRPDGALLLIQYVPHDETPDPATLLYFRDLYAQMGFPNNEARLVHLASPDRPVAVLIL